MKYSEVLNNLYSNDLDGILKVLNQSIYVTDFVYHEKESIVIHTGFTFNSHKGKKFELLYDIHTKTIIRQIRNDSLTIIPQLNGVILVKNGQNYFNSYTNIVVSEITLVNNNDEEFEIFKLKNPEVYRRNNKIEKIELIDEENNKELSLNSIKIIENNVVKHHVDLQKHLKEKIFYDGITFSKYLSDNEYYQKSNSHGYNEDYEQDNYNHETHGKYAGTWAQDIEGLSDDFIDDVLGGEPDAYWNID